MHDLAIAGYRTHILATIRNEDSFVNALAIANHKTLCGLGCLAVDVAVHGYCIYTGGLNHWHLIVDLGNEVFRDTTFGLLENGHFGRKPRHSCHTFIARAKARVIKDNITDA